MKIKKPLFYIVITIILALVFVIILFLKTNIKDTIDSLLNGKDTICTVQIYMEDVSSLWEPTSTDQERLYAIDSEGNIVYYENWWDKRFPVSATYDKKNVKKFFNVLKSVDPIYDSKESGLENYADAKRKNSIIVMYTDKDKITSKTITLTEEDFNKVISEANSLVIPILPVKDEIDTGYVDEELTEENPYSTDTLNAVVGENAFIITLYPDVAPITCENFEKLVRDGFYDGLTFHRVIDDFMAQGGDSKHTPTNGIIGEFSANGVENNLSHQRGVVSMVHDENDYNSAYDEFFISYSDNSFLDGIYAAFGEVTDGMSVVDSFLNVARKEGDDGTLSVPMEPIVMEKVIMIDDDKNGNPRVEVIMSKEI